MGCSVPGLQPFPQSVSLRLRSFTTRLPQTDRRQTGENTQEPLSLHWHRLRPHPHARRGERPAALEGVRGARGEDGVTPAIWGTVSGEAAPQPGGRARAAAGRFPGLPGGQVPLVTGSRGSPGFPSASFLSIRVTTWSLPFRGSAPRPPPPIPPPALRARLAVNPKPPPETDLTGSHRRPAVSAPRVRPRSSRRRALRTPGAANGRPRAPPAPRAHPPPGPLAAQPSPWHAGAPPEPEPEPGWGGGRAAGWPGSSAGGAGAGRGVRGPRGPEGARGEGGPPRPGLGAVCSPEPTALGARGKGWAPSQTPGPPRRLKWGPGENTSPLGGFPDTHPLCPVPEGGPGLEGEMGRCTPSSHLLGRTPAPTSPRLGDVRTSN